MNIRRWLWLWLGLAGLFAACAAQSAEAPPKRIGYLVWSTPGERGVLEQALLDELRTQGYVEGRNLEFVRRYVEVSGVENVERAADELAALKLDVIVSTCSPSTAAARRATQATGTPVVMAVVADPVGQGLIASLARPGGNVTGMASEAEGSMLKMLEYITAVAPKGARIAVLYNTSNPVHSRLWRELGEAAKSRDIELLRVDVARGADLPAAFDTIARQRPGALLVLPDDNMTFNNRGRIIDLAARQRIPAIYGASEFVAAGGLMSYGLNYAASYRQAATYVKKVLAGEPPRDLAVGLPTRFELVVNTATAKSLGVTLPPTILQFADVRVP
jgi:putative ABC transport system substrate-binding protein